MTWSVTERHGRPAGHIFQGSHSNRQPTVAINVTEKTIGFIKRASLCPRSWRTVVTGASLVMTERSSEGIFNLDMIGRLQCDGFLGDLIPVILVNPEKRVNVSHPSNT